MQNFQILCRIWKHVSDYDKQEGVIHCFVWGCGALTVGGVVPKLGFLGV